MPVFNLCIKILKKNIPMMMIYFGIFILVSIIMKIAIVPAQANVFSQTKTDIAFISQENTALVNGLKEELSGVANFVELKDDKAFLQDALFFRRVKYIVRIPKGFTNDFLSGKNPKIEKTMVPNATSNIYIDMKINQYLNTAKLYYKNTKPTDQSKIIANIKKDLSLSTEVKYQNTKVESRASNNMSYFFNYMAYTLMFVVILGVSTIMMIFNNLDIKRRNACAPIAANVVNFQFILANLVFTLISWVILVLVSLLFDMKEIFEINTLYYVMNSFAFVLSVSGISFLIGNFVKGHEAISMFANIVTLGSSFICGVFVPQFLLGENVLRIASFLPTYWFVKANNRIAEITSFGGSNIKEILGYMLIEFGFAAAFFIIAMVAGKRKWMSREEF